MAYINSKMLTIPCNFKGDKLYQYAVMNFSKYLITSNNNNNFQFLMKPRRLNLLIIYIYFANPS